MTGLVDHMVVGGWGALLKWLFRFGDVLFSTFPLPSPPMVWALIARVQEPPNPEESQLS